jgi:hypothetical protein
VDARRFGEAGLVGWRGRAAERAAQTLARRTRWSEQQVRTALGVLLLAVTFRRAVRMLRRLARG